MKNTRMLIIFLLVLGGLSPLGLILPQHFNAGDAWGEWGKEELAELVGYVPPGLKHHSDRWISPLPDYALRDQDRYFSLSYIGSAVLGMSLTGTLVFMIGRILTRNERQNPDASRVDEL